MQIVILALVIGTSLILCSMSGSIAAVAFPQIMADFKTSIVGTGWVLSIYQIVATVTTPLGGKASDIFGSKRLFVICLILFFMGSLGGALAPDLITLIVFRFVQAIAYGGLLPCAVSLAVDQVPHYRLQLIGLLPTIGATGQIIGPNLGGWMISAFGWRSIFWLNVPTSLILIVCAQSLFKNTSKEKGRLDITGSVLLTGLLSAFLFDLTLLAEPDIPWLMVGCLFVLFIAMMVAFIKYETKTATPIIDITLLKEKRFLAMNLFNVFTGISNFGISSFIPFYMVSLYAASTLASGAILTPRSIMVIIIAGITSMMLPRWGYRRPILIGSICVLAAMLIFGFQPQDMSIGTLQIASIVIIGSSLGLSGFFGMAGPAINNALIDTMPDRVATIIGIRGMFYQCGGAIGIAVISIILNVFKDNLAQGFAIVFYGLAALMLLALPMIPVFATTASPKPHGKGS
jgi:MFS family permease